MRYFWAHDLLGVSFQTIFQRLRPKYIVPREIVADPFCRAAVMESLLHPADTNMRCRQQTAFRVRVSAWRYLQPVSETLLGFIVEPRRMDGPQGTWHRSSAFEP